jgi:anti-sigma factor RsiW
MSPVSLEPELSCRELVELVTDYLEGALPPAEVRRFDAHLATCPHCGRYLEQIRAAVKAAGRVGEEAWPPGATAELLRAFRSWKAGELPSA